MRTILIAIACAMISFALAAPTWAAKAPPAGSVDVTPAEFDAQADKVRQIFEEGGYAKVSASDRRVVEDYLAIISRILGKRGSSLAMTGQEKMDVFNMQERINGILAGGADYRVCSVNNQTGSHFKSKQCVSAKQKEDLRREEHDALVKMYSLHGLPAGGVK